MSTADKYEFQTSSDGDTSACLIGRLARMVFLSAMNLLYGAAPNHPYERRTRKWKTRLDASSPARQLSVFLNEIQKKAKRSVSYLNNRYNRFPKNVLTLYNCYKKSPPLNRFHFISFHFMPAP
jgi:hypothetical protein